MCTTNWLLAIVIHYKVYKYYISNFYYTTQAQEVTKYICMPNNYYYYYYLLTILAITCDHKLKLALCRYGRRKSTRA